MSDCFPTLDLNSLRLRKAEPRDCHLFWLHFHDPLTRSMGFGTATIGVETHRAWWEEVFTDPNIHLYLIEVDPCGVVGDVRFQPLDGDDNHVPSIPHPVRRRLYVNVSIAVTAPLIEMGIGQLAVYKAMELARELGFGALRAQIKAGNIRSVLTFYKCGFRMVSREKEIYERDSKVILEYEL